MSSKTAYVAFVIVPVVLVVVALYSYRRLQKQRRDSSCRVCTTQSTNVSYPIQASANPISSMPPMDSPISPSFSNLPYPTSPPALPSRPPLPRGTTPEMSPLPPYPAYPADSSFPFPPQRVERMVSVDLTENPPTGDEPPPAYEDIMREAREKKVTVEESNKNQ